MLLSRPDFTTRRTGGTGRLRRRREGQATFLAFSMASARFSTSGAHLS